MCSLASVIFLVEFQHIFCEPNRFFLTEEQPKICTNGLSISLNFCFFSTLIADIVYVVDRGYVKITAYDRMKNASTLVPILVSKDEAAQRRSFAGR